VRRTFIQENKIDELIIIKVLLTERLRINIKICGKKIQSSNVLTNTPVTKFR